LAEESSFWQAAEKLFFEDVILSAGGVPDKPSVGLLA
jgi:hypothetical protein